ncbi:hypothetical protein C1646_757271 [Rhizophagus diaphanus]|nr:hypothetical protein C1646_757271 [Rhizophagus diaphanus] [Rhizophagus sp. MUCL 43196]
MYNKKADLFHSHDNNLPYEHSTCNKCCEKHKNTQKEIDLISRKKVKLEANLNAPIPNINIMLSQTNIDSNQTIFSDLTKLELDNSSFENYENNINEHNDGTDGLLYEIQELISKQFQSAEELNEPVKLAFEIELNSKLIEDIFSELQPDTYDLETLKKNFHQLVNVLLLLFEYRSGYY